VECTAFIFSVKDAKQETSKIFLPPTPFDVLCGLLFSPENGGDIFFINFGGLLPDYTVSRLRRKYSS
jgi:hypothetical protein